MKINLRESLNELDVLSNNRYDLYNTYLSKNPSLDTKKKLSEAIYNNKSPKEILMILNEDWDDEESEWTEMDNKSVRDSDGFLTDYTWYWRANNGKDQHVFVFGDSDLYRPEDGYFDWECDSLEEAQDWFDGYIGPGDDEDDGINESLNEDSSNTYKYTGKVFFDNLKDPNHYAVDRNDLYSNLFDFDIKNDTSLDSKIRKAIEKVDYDIFIDDENDHKYEDDDNNDSNYDDYDDDDGSSGSISITIITNRSLTKKEIDKLEKFYVETGNESYFTGILDDLVFTEYSNEEAIKKLEHDCYMIVANGVKKFEETFIKPLNLYGYSNASIYGGGIEKGEITGQYDFNYRYKNYTIYSDTHLIRISIDEIYSNPEKYINQIFNDLKDEWLKEIKEVDSKSADESLKEDLNLDDFMEPVDQVGKAKIYYDSNKRTYFTPSLDLDFDTLDKAKDFIGAPLYTDESLNETIVYPNGMPASDIDIHDALNFNFGLDRDMNDDNYTDEEKQRSLNYWINKMDEIDESLNEASYGGAYDIEDDMFFTKEELVEFAGDIAEEFSKLTGHSNCDVDNVYIENDPLALNVDIYDPKDEVSHSAYTRIDMRKIRKPSDIYKYMDRILKQLEDSFHEYHENDFEQAE